MRGCFIKALVPKIDPGHGTSRSFPGAVIQRHDTGGAVEAIHQALRETLPLDDFFVCPHDDSDQCDCRKPLPGLLLRAAEKYAIDLPRSFMVGDRWRDVDAGVSAGCATVWIDYGYREKYPATEPSAQVDSIRAAADWILRQP